MPVPLVEDEFGILSAPALGHEWLERVHRGFRCLRKARRHAQRIQGRDVLVYPVDPFSCIRVLSEHGFHFGLVGTECVDFTPLAGLGGQDFFPVMLEQPLLCSLDMLFPLHSTNIRRLPLTFGLPFCVDPAFFCHSLGVNQAAFNLPE